MMESVFPIWHLILCITIQVLFTFLLPLWISERFKAKLQKENISFLESIRWDVRVREQAAKVAEYMALSYSLKETDSQAEYRKANQLSWELSLWLPADIYREMSQALQNPNEQFNPLVVLIKVRALLLQNKYDDLTPNDLLSHAPGIGLGRVGS